MSILPTAPEALARSIEAFAAGDRDAARYWLDVAAELRWGTPLFASAVSARDDGPPAAESDATAVLTLATGTLECRACGKELIYHLGDNVHRSTYRTECDSIAAAEDRWRVFSSTATS